MTGYDKASFDEREAYTMEHLDEIYDSADHPLDVRFPLCPRRLGFSFAPR